MALDHNDQRAQNFTSGAVLDKHLNKVIIPSGKNAELLEKIREIVGAGVKDIYGDASDRKYQKIVNLIMKRLGAKLEDTGISSDVSDLSESLSKDIVELKKEIKASNEKAAKSDKPDNADKSSTAVDKSLNLLLEKIQDKILELRKEQQKELNDLKALIKKIASPKAAAKSESKPASKASAKAASKSEDKKAEAKPASKKTEDAEKPKQEDNESQSSSTENFQAFAAEITTVIADLKQHVELALNMVSAKLSLTNDLITTQFAHFDVSFNQIQTQLSNSFQQNTKGFSDVNTNIKATSQNILQAISQINMTSGAAPSAAASVAALPAQILASITSVVSSTMNAFATTITAGVTQVISQAFQRQSAATEKIAAKYSHRIIDVVDKKSAAILSAIGKSAKKTQKTSTENVSKMDRMQQFLGRMRGAVERRITAVNSLVNRWGKKHSKQMDQLKPGFFKRMLSGIWTMLNLVMAPISFLIGGIFGMLSFVFKPLTWLLGLFKSPAMLLFMVGALVFLWPYISEYITGWWNDFVAPAFNWIYDKVSELWETMTSAIADWWSAKWAPYGGFGGFLTDSVWPKVQTFIATVMWPFVTERVWPFIQQHWKGLLVTAGIFTFLKNPMSTLKLALQVPVLILRTIQAAIAIVRMICWATKIISIATQALVAAMPAIIAALPYIMVGILVVALVAAIVAAFSWFDEDSYDELHEQQEKIFKAQQEQLKINWEKNIKEWTKNDTQKRLEQIWGSVSRLDANMQEMLRLQGIKTVQEERYDTGINGMSATGSEIQELMDKSFTMDSMREDAVKANGGKPLEIPTFSETTDSIMTNIDKISGAANTLKHSEEAEAKGEKGALSKQEINRYNKMKMYLNKTIANVSFLFDNALHIAQNYAKDVANWSGDPEMGKRVAAFRQWFSTAKDKTVNDMVSRFSNYLQPSAKKLGEGWFSNGYWQQSLGLAGKEGDKRYNQFQDMLVDTIDSTKSSLNEQLKKLMISPKMSKEQADSAAADIDKLISAADQQFENLDERLKKNPGDESGFVGMNLEQMMEEVNKNLGKDTAFGKSQGYGSIGFAKERLEKLEQLKADAVQGLYDAGLEKWNVTKGSSDEKYFTQLQDALVSVGMSQGRNGNLSLEDKIKTYTAVLANVKDELDKTEDPKAKARLEAIEKAMRKQLREFNEEEKKNSGRDIMAENKRDIALKKKWFDMSKEEQAKYGSMENFIESQNKVFIQQNNLTNNNFGGNPNTLQSVPGGNNPPRQ